MCVNVLLISFPWIGGRFVDLLELVDLQGSTILKRWNVKFSLCAHLSLQNWGQSVQKHPLKCCWLKLSGLHLKKVCLLFLAHKSGVAFEKLLQVTKIVEKQQYVHNPFRLALNLIVFRTRFEFNCFKQKINYYYLLPSAIGLLYNRNAKNINVDNIVIGVCNRIVINYLCIILV